MKHMREHEEAFKNTIRDIVIANTWGVIKREIYGSIASFASDSLIALVRGHFEQKAQEKEANDNNEEAGNTYSEEKKEDKEKKSIKKS